MYSRRANVVSSYLEKQKVSFLTGGYAHIIAQRWLEPPSPHVIEKEIRREAFDEKCFAVLDSANTAFKLKVKEALHIMWERPNLNLP